MPQLEPYTLELQFNSAVILVAVTVILLSCYVLPKLSKLMIARTHITI